MKDKREVLKNKMDMLGTLEAGIVFGKEEAWDKLQDRLDRKPLLLSRSKRSIAAAAVLFIMCGVAFVLTNGRRTEPATSAVNLPVPTTVPAAEKTAVVPAARPAPTAPEVASRQVIVPLRVADEKQVATTPCTSAVIVPLNAASIPAAMVAVPRPMKVLHIDDVEGGAALQSTSPVSQSAAATPDFARMRVRHISDVETEAAEVKAILSENRLSTGTFPFSRQLYHDPESEQTEFGEKHSLIKNMFNPQN